MTAGWLPPVPTESLDLVPRRWWLVGGGEKLWGERAGEMHVQGPGRGSPQSKGSWRKAFRAGEARGVAARGGGLRQETPAWGAVRRAGGQCRPRRHLVAAWGCPAGLARGPARRWSRHTCSPRPSPFSSPFDLWRVRENVKIRNFFPWQVILKPIQVEEPSVAKLSISPVSPF